MPIIKYIQGDTFHSLLLVNTYLSYCRSNIGNSDTGKDTPKASHTQGDVGLLGPKSGRRKLDTFEGQVDFAVELSLMWTHLTHWTCDVDTMTAQVTLSEDGQEAK